MMKLRKVIKTVRGEKAIDGAGVHLVRVLGHGTVRDFDPFLMLDSFDSTNPPDYIEGFPFHPHRGIETLTYLIEGEMEHEDSLGNKGTIFSGDSQWMTAGSGIMHQEMPKAAPHMLGLQIWINLPQEEKMATPAYFGITKEMAAIKEEEFDTVRVVSGKYKDLEGVKAPHWQVTFYDITVNPEKEVTLDTISGENVFVFLILGDAQINDEIYTEKTAILFDEEGDSITIKALDKPCRFMFFSGKKINEPISWGGPIVMNTREELQNAFDELRSGEFIKHAPSGTKHK